jgi:hypothetical protein
MAYQTGDVILDDHYNLFATGNVSGTATDSANVNNIWGVGFGNSGYGQSSTLSPVAAGMTVTATQWSTLLARLNSIASHQGTAISLISSPTAGESIAAYSSLLSNINAVYLDRNNATSFGADVNTVPSVTVGEWVRRARHTLVCNFQNADSARYFFNAGGRIRLGFGLSGGSSSAAYNEWSDLINVKSGALLFGARNIIRDGGTGTPGIFSFGIGYYDLTTEDQEIFRIYADTAPFTDNYISVKARYTGVTGTNGDRSSQITFTVSYEAEAGFSVINGNLATSCTFKMPSDSHLTNTWSNLANPSMSSQRVTPFPFVGSVSPSTPVPGSTVTISGINFSGVDSVRIGDTNVNFSIVNSTTITATVPQAVPNTSNSIVVARGEFLSNDNITIVYGTPAPVVSAVSPSAGFAGNQVTITGNHFDYVTSVRFGTVSVTPTKVNNTTMTAIVPAGTIGNTVSVVAVSSGLLSNSNVTFTYSIPAPTITSIAPLSGFAGDTVIINGSNFTFATEVKFGGVNASFVIVNSTRISATIPTGTAGQDVAVTVINTDVVSNDNLRFTYGIPAAVVASISPTVGFAGQTITISGSNFNFATRVLIGSNESPQIFIDSPTTIRAVVPSGTVNTSVAVVVFNGTVPSNSNVLFGYSIPEPVITSLTPPSGFAGDTVIINGSNFLDATAVRFGSTTASFVIESNTRIRVTVPAGTVGTTVAVKVTNITVDSNTNITYAYAIPTSTITSVSPNSGFAGDTITITGTNFSSVTSVRIGNNVAGSLSIKSDTSMTVTVPSGISGSTVSVVAFSGTLASNNNITFTYSIPVPTISLVSPSSGFVGQTVTITGSNFDFTTSVRFGNSSAIFTRDSNTQIRATVPAGTTGSTVAVVVSNSGVDSTSSRTFTYAIPLPEIASVSPTSGFAGNSVTIQGNNFDHVQTVQFGTANASFTRDPVATNTRMTAIVPPGTVGTTVSVSALNTAQQRSNTDKTFGYTIPRPVVLSVSPSGGLSGISVVITGREFNNVSAVQFGTVAATAFTRNSETQITATVPAGTAGTNVVVTVTTTGGTSTDDVRYTYGTPIPVLTSVTPDTGRAGNTVTITGQNFDFVTEVRFGAVTASFTRPAGSTTSLTATVPSGISAGTTVNVTLVSNGGISGVKPFRFLYPIPTISTVTPGSGFVNNSVVITGTGFNSVQTILFGAATATFERDPAATDTRIIATVPSNNVGQSVSVSAINLDGTPSTINGTFSYTIPLPEVSFISPTGGFAGSDIIITGREFNNVTAVQFGTVAATAFTRNSSTQITARVPTGQPGTSVRVSVTTSGGTSTENVQYTYAIPRPTISQITPTSGLRGSSVTITGTNFDFVFSAAAGGVKFDNISASYTRPNNSTTTIVATVPSGIELGKIAKITASGAGGVSESRDFRILYPLATIGSVTPNKGYAGDTVTIAGTNFEHVKAVRFGTVTVTAFQRDPTAPTTRLTVTVPPGVIESTVNLVLLNQDDAPNNSVTYEYDVPVPVLLSITPDEGIPESPVTITGRDLTYATEILFNNTSVPFTRTSDTQINISSIPSFAVDTVVQITARNKKNVTSSTSLVFTYAPYIRATGGTVTNRTFGGLIYRVHTFNSSGTFTINNIFKLEPLSLLLVGGGGGGGHDGNGAGGGGGAGGLLVRSKSDISTGAFPVVVGEGGARNESGSDSSLFGNSVKGGGAGGGYKGGTNDTAPKGKDGGSGGGAGQASTNMSGTTNKTISGGTGVSGQGRRGGNSIMSAGWSVSGGGGGGGHRTAGSDTGSKKSNGFTYYPDGGDGGGASAIEFVGSTYILAGGGGGGGSNSSGTAGPAPAEQGSAGEGGSVTVNSVKTTVGGRGGRQGVDATSGTPNTGSGGGGRAVSASGASGGSGVVLIAYPIGVA